MESTVELNGYKITEAGDVITDLFKYRDTYNQKGKYLGFEKMHEHYSMSLGNCTDWTGFPMSGKTQVLMECLMNTSKFEENLNTREYFGKVAKFYNLSDEVNKASFELSRLNKLYVFQKRK